MARKFAIQNPEILLENMVLVRDICARRKLVCFLHFGTLLGAIREKGFIPHDDDADLGMFWTDLDAVLTSIPEFLNAGFQFESLRNGRLLQFIRKGEQVDIFFAIKKKTFFGHLWAIDERTTISSTFLDSLEEIDFLGHQFYRPSMPEKLMHNLYGKTWMIPLSNIPSRTNWSWKIKKIIKKPGKLAYYAKRFIGTTLRKNK